MAKDPAVLAHQEWLGYVQPVGLVVSIPALLDANARINQNFGPEHRCLLDALPADAKGEPIPEISDFPAFAETVLGWAPSDIYGAPGNGLVPDKLEFALPEYGETLRPTYALREFQPDENAREWILLVKVLPGTTNFDEVVDGDTRHWQASPQTKFERLLRSVKVLIGLLVNREQIRLVYAPEKELSGHITFLLPDMVKVAGRPIYAAFQMLLSVDRLFNLAERERLPAILESSRKYQNVVSTQLANQVLEALYELLRGFQAANDQSQGELLRDVLARDPDIVYRGLLTTLLRLVFILYAEDRGLLSTDPVYANYYSVTGLYERLRVDDGRYPDTMDQRFGAWAQLLTLFRLIYRGGSHGGLRIPAREGYLFDPDRYPFLEGRRHAPDPVSVPRVPDGVLFRVLSKLMILDGERISYRTLAVEQIGSVYEAIMGFELHVASGPSIAIKPAKKHGAPTTINLEALLATAPNIRLKVFTEETEQKLTGTAVNALKSARSIADLQAALAKKIANSVTPDLVAKGAMIFQPSDERRRSGSHYTPSSLTGPIVEAALAPVLRQLGDNPSPAQILGLKVCDPAMGSGAFLVEACRQLGDALSKAWHAHGEAQPLPPDEDEVLHAQRQIAQRCLYGIDKNPMATDLAKLSLWLATLAKDHPFTFLDHSLRTGDSLVGLSRNQIAAFNWNEDDEQQSFLEAEIRGRVQRAGQYRERILAARDDVPYSQLKQELEGAEEPLRLLQQVGDIVIAAFFSADKPKAREAARLALRHITELSVRDVTDIESYGKIDEARQKLHRGPKGIRPFHWELEFPEVFQLGEHGQRTFGFDAIVGNPPFAGKNTLTAAHQGAYPDWLKMIHKESHGNADIVAHFFRRAFGLIRNYGCMGLIATNTIGQGDTRSTGLRWICRHSGTIYRATKRLRWPGEAAVIVSVIHICRGDLAGPYLLNERHTDRITAYLFHAGDSEDPFRLESNSGKSFQGCVILGVGFIFDDAETKGIASTLADMRRLIEQDPRNEARIFPYLGGEEANDSAIIDPKRFVINFEDYPLKRKSSGHSWFQLTEDTQREQLRNGIVAPDYPHPVAEDWPALLQILTERVKPTRELDNREARRREWWKFAERAPALTQAKRRLSRVLITSQTSKYRIFCFVPAKWVFDQRLVVITEDCWGLFAVLSARPHEYWAAYHGSTMKDDPVYTPSDCFETFPFPYGYESFAELEQVAIRYYEHRAGLMIQNGEGLTKTYNRLHDPNEDSPEICRLRELHDALDRAVLDAYGWYDIRPACRFIAEFNDEDDEDEGSRLKRKKYRYRWSSEVHDEVLARLLDLNRQRAVEEGQGLTAPEPEDAPPRSARRNDSHRLKAQKQGADPAQLFTEVEEV